ncbi:12439_t:CDS:2 [Funneliformis caledonium]|uniref:12439_t:CDS:1 n=1 Tax=Funneliformis caledonium TaxID=1117310 RepID=A0A9N9HF58_9GLOM|nr:12439_t:CDS:2 [Funneliformis caledonium]
MSRISISRRQVEGTLTRIQRFVQQYRHRIRDGNTLDDFIQRAWLPDSKATTISPSHPMHNVTVIVGALVPPKALVRAYVNRDKQQIHIYELNELMPTNWN